MVDEIEQKSLIRKIDCIRIPVSDLESGLRFYSDSLGHELIWRTETSAGLRIPESKAELVIHTEQDEFEVDLTVNLVEVAAERFVKAGGSIVTGPFEIPIGKCVIVEDPWGNRLVFLDNSKGTFITDDYGKVIGLH
ncbi:MAG: bleomycin resistance protein [Candidatus Lokiarchaeota archaeon]|nr:bleomycin resistance protein [Candidatus Lokiarchaeota archaeon]